MELPVVSEKWTGNVKELTIGATKEDGGTRESTITVGGAKCIPFMEFDGDIGHRPVIAMDVLDYVPDDWPEILKETFKDVLDDPAKWAKKCIDEYGADLVCLKLDSVHPDKGDKSGEEAADTVKAVLEAIDVPLIIQGCELNDKDNQIMPKVSEAAKGEKCLLGFAAQDNYKVITAVCLADGHSIVTQAPLDINIGKQVNILVSELGFPLDRIVMFQSTGALGYGIEYTYSIQERERIAALSGDNLMAFPVICNAGFEAWRAKEAKAKNDEVPQWGDQKDRGPMWETITATTLIQSGVDIVRMYHPKAVSAVKKYLDELTASN
ncbi:MAG: CO dehydrogenase/acetyl-CoA synthase subunit delta [Candidatus Anammoxibacter sp.]